jgi:hypothetical protein
MAWANTVKQVVGDMVDSSYMNTYHRDRLDFLSTHGHTGAAGDGAAILTSLDYIDFDQQGALAEPATGHTRVAMNTGGTFRWRANGAAEKTASIVGHTH